MHSRRISRPVTLFWQRGSTSFCVELPFICRAPDKGASTTNLKSLAWFGRGSNPLPLVSKMFEFLRKILMCRPFRKIQYHYLLKLKMFCTEIEFYVIHIHVATIGPPPGHHDCYQQMYNVLPLDPIILWIFINSQGKFYIVDELFTSLTSLELSVDILNQEFSHRKCDCAWHIFPRSFNHNRHIDGEIITSDLLHLM